MQDDNSRWVEVTRSQFTFEAEGLSIVRQLLPDSSPFRAWSNFEFRDNHGKWHEVDLLVLGRRRLHLVELKYYRGILRGDDHRWLRDGRRAEDSPLKLAHRKAQRLATRLKDELREWAREQQVELPDMRTVVPFVQEAVFLHHPDLGCDLRSTARIDLFGIDGAEENMRLPGIGTRLLEPPTSHESIGPNREEILTKLLARIGLVQRRQREVGSWVIDEEPLADGDGWQDWPAFHRVATTDRARIRFYVSPPGAAQTDRVRLRRLAEHEFRIMSRLNHEGLLRPRDMVEDELGTGLAYPYDDQLRRLDLWLAEQPDGVPAATQLAVLRRVAEAVGYAHRHRVVHRGLTPSAVHLRMRTDREPVVLVGDWQIAGSTGGDASHTGSGSADATVFPGSSGAGGRLSALLQPGVDLDRQFAEVFQAPEGVWNRSADRVRLDVFALGALAYYLVAGRPPAADRAGLRERLQRDRGLDLAADLPQVSSALRELVLAATRPAVSDRLPDVATFLLKLAKVEQQVALPADLLATDPLEAAPGAVLDGRFRLERRLGAGSTAVGLLVTDLADDEQRVLKVAIDDGAAQRLDAEAEVLRGLRHPRLVRLAEGPLEVGGRRALLLEHAGDQTLAEMLRQRARLSLDLLARWGADLLEALGALDKAGVDHRDIKPANLGVKESRRAGGDRAKHLVLFDFSLARVGAAAVNAGTPPYLDPFLEQRGRYDSAAERYSAAVVLFEMATGAPPVYGDGQSDPLVVDEEATVRAEQFDASVAEACVAFFRRALARDAAQRHHTAADMLTAWRGIFAPVDRTVPDDLAERAAQAGPQTPLAEAGLSAWALSAVEPLGVQTAADLAAVDPARLSRLAGVSVGTRREVSAWARAWRNQFAERATGATRPARLATGASPAAGSLPTAAAAASMLHQRAGTARAHSRRRAAALLLGLDGDLDPFASMGELGEALGASRVRGTQLVPALQQAWEADPEARDLLDTLAGFTREAVSRLGGVAAVAELTDEILAQLPPAADGEPTDRSAAGLLRVALDRLDTIARDPERAEPDQPRLLTRRRDGRVALLATEPLLFDAVEAAARRADALVAEADQTGEAVVPRQRASQAVVRAAAKLAPEAPGLTSDRLVRLAARMSRRAAVSGHGELYDRALAPATAVGRALAGLGAGEQINAQEVRDRVRARFPALPPLPERPRLDELLQEAGLPLRYDEQARRYGSPAAPPDTTGLGTLPPSPGGPVELAPVEVGGGAAGQRLRESVRTRSFLALGVDGLRVDRAVELVTSRHRATVVDVTRVLVEALRARAAEAGVPWELVRAADAAQPGTRDALGLAALVEQALPAIGEAVTAAEGGAPAGTRPVLLTELAPLARYGHLSLLTRWSDLAAPRQQPIWLVVPQLINNQGPLIDGRPLPLAAPGQFVRLDADWLATAPVAG